MPCDTYGRALQRFDVWIEPALIAEMVALDQPLRRTAEAKRQWLTGTVPWNGPTTLGEFASAPLQSSSFPPTANCETHQRPRPSQRGALLGRFPYRGRQTAGINSPADGTIAAAWFSARHERAAMTVGRGDEASGFCRGARWLRHACHRSL